jgi:hypothetical protein
VGVALFQVAVRFKVWGLRKPPGKRNMKALVIYRVEIQYPGMKRGQSFASEKASAMKSAKVASVVHGARSAVFAVCVSSSPEKEVERLVKEYGVA